MKPFLRKFTLVQYLVLSVPVMGLTTSVSYAQSSTSKVPEAQAQKDHRVVIELTTSDAAQWQGVLNNVENVQKALGSTSTQVEVVAHGEGLSFLFKGKNSYEQRMRTLVKNNVVFAACENTMKAKNIKKDDLVDFAIPVDSGVAELVRKQETGWSYLKGGR